MALRASCWRWGYVRRVHRTYTGKDLSSQLRSVMTQSSKHTDLSVTFNEQSGLWIFLLCLTRFVMFFYMFVSSGMRDYLVK